MGSKTMQVKAPGSQASPARLTSARSAGRMAVSSGVKFHAVGSDLVSCFAKNRMRQRLDRGRERPLCN